MTSIRETWQIQFAALLCTVLLSVAIQAQQDETTGSTSPSGPALERLKIEFTNGTPDADGLGSITGVVFDYKSFQASRSSGQSSLLEQLKQQGTSFRTTESSVQVNLDEPTNSPMLVVIYKGGIYQKQLSPDSAEHSVQMTVYEPTQNKESIRIERHHIPLQRRENKLQVSEVLVLKNTGNRTFVGPEGVQKSIPITLPAEAHQVRIGGSRRRPESGTDGNTSRYWLSKTLSPDQPISTRIQYHLPLEGETTLERQVDYLTSTFFFAVGKTGLRVVDHSDNLSKQTRSAPDGKGNVVQLLGGNLSSDQTVSVTLEPIGSGGGTGMSSGSETTSGATNTGSSRGTDESSTMMYVLIAVGAVAGLAFFGSLVAIIMMLDSPESSPGSAKDAGMTREILMDEIAQLDQDLEEGKISEEYHEQRRDRLKSRLMELEKARLS